MPSLRAAALTDIGRVRRENEDRFLFDEQALVFGVADGVGGLPGGAEAAQTTVDEITAALQRIGPGGEPDLVAIVHQTNKAVAALGQKISPNMGIGTTLTLGCVRGSSIQIAHVGDSRGYAMSKGEFLRLTEDHSVENEARMRRARGEVVYYHEANRNALTRCIGQPTAPDVDIIERPLATGDRYLFCTDGVTRMISDEELGALMAKADNPKSALDEIISLAVRRGGPDNATGVMVFVDAA
jgi:serine/threonine protein phosphatase PrpC